MRFGTWVCFALALYQAVSRHSKLTFGLRQADPISLNDSQSRDSKPDTAVALFVDRWSPNNSPCVRQKLSKIAADVLGIYDVWVFINELPVSAGCSHKSCLNNSKWNMQCLHESCFLDLNQKPYHNVKTVYYGDGLPNEYNISDSSLFDQMCWSVDEQQYRKCSEDESKWWCSAKNKHYPKESCIGKVPPKKVVYCKFRVRGEDTIAFAAGGLQPHYIDKKNWRMPWPSICWHPREGVELFQGVSGRAKPMLLAFIERMDYKHVWHVEHDMVFTGNWREFFEGAGKGHEATDFLTHTLEETVDPEWPHWNSPFIESMPRESWTKLTFMISRISKRFGTIAFDRLLAGKLGGHHEAVLGTLCSNTKGCEFGAFDRKYVGFVTTGHWAAHSVGCWGDPKKQQCGCCQLGKNAPPPEITEGVDLSAPAKDKLYHPIKTCNLGD
jgi:hypothetical protein